MRRAADRIFVDADPRREESGNQVVLSANASDWSRSRRAPGIARAAGYPGVRPRTFSSLSSSTRRSKRFGRRTRTGAPRADCSSASSLGIGNGLGDRLGGEIKLDSIGTRSRGQQAAARLEERGLAGGKMAFFPQDMGRRQRGMSAEVDFASRSEPSQAEFRAVSEAPGERCLREVHLGRHVLHPLLVGRLGEHADRRGVAGERALGECVDLGDANAHESLPAL